MASSLCEECNAKVAVLECKDCTQPFCNACDQLIHQYGTLRNHQKIHLDNLCAKCFESAQVECSSCQVMYCRKCYQELHRQGTRKAHTSTPIARRAGVKHVGINCNECKEEVLGARYACIHCVNYNLCGPCSEQSKHSVAGENIHLFAVIGAPLPRPLPSPLHPLPVQSPKPPYATIHACSCDGCKQSNFAGDRYRCLVCSDFDFCSSCFTRFALVQAAVALGQPQQANHDVNHSFVQIRIPWPLRIKSIPALLGPLKEAIPHPSCSFLETGKKMVPMEFYRCVDCAHPKQYVMCAGCAALCHVGHYVRAVGRGTGYCDCGTDPNKCKAQVVFEPEIVEVTGRPLVKLLPPEKPISGVSGPLLKLQPEGNPSGEQPAEKKTGGYDDVEKEEEEEEPTAACGRVGVVEQFVDQSKGNGKDGEHLYGEYTMPEHAYDGVDEDAPKVAKKKGDPGYDNDEIMRAHAAAAVQRLDKRDISVQQQDEKAKPKVNKWEDIDLDFDWTESFTKVLDLPGTTAREKLIRASKINSICDKFSAHVSGIAKTIVDELHIPNKQKTFPPVDAGGIAGGEKYKVGRLFFKMALDWKGLYGGDEYSMKACSCEIKGLKSYLELCLPKLRFPLMVQVDYAGYRLIATSLLPIADGSLVYGSDNQGDTVHFDDTDVNEMMKVAGGRLNLKGHYASGDRSQLIFSCTDIEVHKTPKCYYLLDAARVFPPQEPRSVITAVVVTVGKDSLKVIDVPAATAFESIAQILMASKDLSKATTLKTLTANGITTIYRSDATGPRNFRACMLTGYELRGDVCFVSPNKNCHLYRMLRPELVKSFSKPLSSDAFSRFGAHGAKVHNPEVAQATLFLRDKVLTLAAELQSLTFFAPSSSTELMQLLHQRGINCFSLGRLRSALPVESQDLRVQMLRQLICVEMVGRVWKNIIRARLRGLIRPASMSVENYRELVLTDIVKSLNFVLGKRGFPQSKTGQPPEGCHNSEVWNTIVKAQIHLRFGAMCSPLTEAELNSNDIGPSIPQLPLLQLLARKLGLVIEPSTYSRLQEPGAFETMTPLRVEDIRSLVPEPHSFHNNEAYFSLLEHFKADTFWEFAEGKTGPAFEMGTRVSRLLFPSYLMTTVEALEFEEHFHSVLAGSFPDGGSVLAPSLAELARLNAIRGASRALSDSECIAHNRRALDCVFRALTAASPNYVVGATNVLIPMELLVKCYLAIANVAFNFARFSEAQEILEQSVTCLRDAYGMGDRITNRFGGHPALQLAINSLLSVYRVRNVTEMGLKLVPVYIDIGKQFINPVPDTEAKRAALALSAFGAQVPEVVYNAIEHSFWPRDHQDFYFEHTPPAWKMGQRRVVGADTDERVEGWYRRLHLSVGWSGLTLTPHTSTLSAAANMLKTLNEEGVPTAQPLVMIPCDMPPAAGPTSCAWRATADGGWQVLPVRLPRAEADSKALFAAGGDGGSARGMVAATVNGELFASGDVTEFMGISRNEYDQTFPGNRNRTMLHVVASMMAKRVIKVAMGTQHVVLIADDGEAFSTGEGFAGHEKTMSKSPRFLEMPKGEVVVDAACGMECALLVTKSGQVYSYGRGHLGLGKDAQPRAAPTLVPFSHSQEPKIVTIAASQIGWVALDVDGRLFVVGSFSWLGRGSLDVPTLVETGALRFRSVAISDFHWLLIERSGRVYVMGRGNWGGHDNALHTMGARVPMDLVKPTVIPDLAYHKVVQVGCTGFDSYALTESGLMFGWGMSVVMGEVVMPAGTFKDNSKRTKLHVAARSVPTMLDLSPLRGRKVINFAIGPQSLVLITE